MPQQVPLPSDVSAIEKRVTYSDRTLNSEQHDKQTVADNIAANNNGNTHQNQANKLNGDNESNANSSNNNNKTIHADKLGDNKNNPNNHNDNITNPNQTNSVKTTKLNGLKNRILQRPPPLILGKVSNFNDNQTQSSNKSLSSDSSNKPQLQHLSGTKSQPSANNLLKSSNNINQDQQQQVIPNQNNSANHKFWASLNLNAQSRTKNNLANRNATDSNSMTLPHQQHILEHSIDSKNSNHNNNTIVGATQFGVDLIITDRKTNNCATVGASGLSNASNNASQSSVQKQQHQMAKPTAFDQERLTSDMRDEPLDDNKPNDMFNNSEFDDSSTHGGIASENDGGNLIGVDNPTPPASTGAASDSHRAALEDPPASATSSRPRSNNPFLATDEELLSNIENETNFHKRPASFIAATDYKSLMLNRQQQQQQQQASSLYNPDHLRSTQQQMVGEQFGKMHIGDHVSGLRLQNQDKIPYLNPQSDSIVVNQHSNPHGDVRDSAVYGTSSMVPQQHLQSIYGTHCQNSDYINYEPTISLDSESAVRKPPPSAIMQLPHWTDAIYELNNAILETSSVAGGAENGEFVYIVQSGDIILELDQIKVSGFTLIEFNQLLESKPVHLLSAVQTKHSHGLTNDLKYFLNCSFPKNSLDKGLQDIIRENIYRRTIPCTTRPPRAGEVDKIDYHFLTREQFVEMNNRNMLLECGMFGNHYYGTMKPFSDLNSLSIYGTLSHKEVSEDMRQPMNANHPAIGSSVRAGALIDSTRLGENPLYENHESLRMNQAHIKSDPTKPVSKVESEPSNLPTSIPDNTNRKLTHNIDSGPKQQQSSPIRADTEALPHGWERVIDQTHGIYYIDHNTQRTQYERPYEIELTKGAMGFGFTLVEADSGVLLVRSVIPGGPAQLNGTIRPGDILLSAVGVPVAGLQHTGIARLFSTFAVGDRIRLTFARSTYVVDANLVPDEYLFSNGTDGNLTVAVNSSSYHNYFNQNMADQESQHQILVDQEFEYITVALMRGDQGFGFTISDSMAGQKVRKIQNNETCVNLKQGDILISLNGQDITKLTHKEVVERLKNYPAGQSVTVVVKRKKRFRSKTPMSMHTANHQDGYSLENTPQRKCKTPSLDGLMLRQSNKNQTMPHVPSEISRPLYPADNASTLPPNTRPHPYGALNNTGIYSAMIPIEDSAKIDPTQSIYGPSPMTNNELYYNQQSHQQHSMSLPIDSHKFNGLKTPSISNSEGLATHDNMTSSVIPSETSLPPMKFKNYGSFNQMNQFNNFMNNDKLVMMQMQQQQYQQMMQPPVSSMHQQQNHDYHHVPLYSNSDLLEAEASLVQVQPFEPTYQYEQAIYNDTLPNNYYANNEEIALQRVQYGYTHEPMLDDYHSNPATFMQQPPSGYTSQATPYQENDEYEYHHVDLDRGNEDSNWGIRLIGGSEVGRAISIGSIVLGGPAYKNGQLKSGDEIIRINGLDVVGATHQHVVELISACQKEASLIVRRKKFSEACEVVLSRNMDEGFGFVIISSGNCALIGRIIEDSPADRCQQLHVRDRIIAVNGRYITPNMQHPEIVNMIKDCGNTLKLRIIPADSYTVELIKSSQNDNFGFSMRGGSEYEGTPLYILRVAPNGLAKDLLNVGDQIIEINNISTMGMTHRQAATIIKFSEPIVKLKLRRSSVIPLSLLVDSPRALQKYNQVTAEMKTVNSNVTPNYFNDGSATSEQHSSLGEELQPQQQQATINNMGYNQSMPLYAS